MNTAAMVSRLTVSGGVACALSGAWMEWESSGGRNSFELFAVAGRLGLLEQSRLLDWFATTWQAAPLLSAFALSAVLFSRLLLAVLATVVCALLLGSAALFGLMSPLGATAGMWVTFSGSCTALVGAVLWSVTTVRSQGPESSTT